MSELQEILRDSFLFLLALVITPTGIFLSDILENYYREERFNCEHKHKHGYGRDHSHRDHE